jgi:hypothetical protein
MRGRLLPAAPHARRTALLGALLATVLAGLGLSCGGGPPPIGALRPVGDGGAANLTGHVVKGPVSGATVTAYVLTADMGRGAELAQGATAADGSYALVLPAYSGDVLLVATGGSYVEEALAPPPGSTGGASPLALNVDLEGVLTGYIAGVPAVANVTPISHLAVALARFHVGKRGEPVPQAVADAFAHLNAHFGSAGLDDLDWQTVTPASLSGGGGAQLTAAQRAAVVLVGLSQWAVETSTRAGISPGGQVNSLSVLTALAEDVGADGLFDGKGNGGTVLVLPSGGTLATGGPTATALDGATVRLGLASAIADFINSASNGSGISIPDIGALTAALSANSDSYLFATPGTTFDVAPPRVTVATAPPAYTNQDTVSFAVAADDGPNSTGVKSVWARTGDGTRVPGVLASPGGNVWTFSGLPTSAGNPGFDVWAVDNANNSGELVPVGPFHLKLPCLKDTVAPTLVFESSVGSYLDERGMTLASSAVPAVYVWPPGTARSPVLPGPGSVWKSVVRLSGGADISAGELEGPNARNVPFLQVSVPVNPTTDAPIASVTYSIEVLPSGPTSTGPLLAAARTAPAVQYFDLPLTLETIPALGDITASPVGLSVLVTATDAAGNVTTKPIEFGKDTEFAFHVLGAPLFVAEDTTYPGAGDLRSIYPFALAAGTYAGKFTGNNGGELARQARFRVFNPHPVTVPVVAAVTGFAASGVEEWDERVWSAGTAQWDVLSGDCTAVDALPCAGTSATPEPYQATAGGPFSCEADTNPQSHPNAAVQVFSSGTGLRSAWTAGNESVPAGSYGDRILVPPAFGTGPASVVVYVGRPFGTFGLPPYLFTTLGNPDGVGRYYRFVQDAYVRGALLSQTECNCDSSRPPVCNQTEVHAFDQRRWTRSLTAASETFSGSFVATSYALVGPTQDLGEGTAQAVPFSGGRTY